MRALDRLWNVRSFSRDPLAFVREKQRQDGDIAHFPMGPMNVTLFSHPRDVEQVYGSAKQLRRSSMLRVIVPVTGESILVSSGEVWKKKRLTAQPVFQPSSVAALAESMRTIVRRHIDKWGAASDAGPVDMKTGAIDLTLEIVTAALFGRGLNELPAGFYATIDTIFDLLARRVENPFSLPLWMPFPKHRRFLNAIQATDEVIYRLLDERLAKGGEGNDLLALLVRSMRSETGTVDRAAVRDELVTYFFAGFETTATTLSWCVYELARHPEQLERVHADPSFATAVILETLRLHPPAWMLDFEAFEPVKVGNVSLKKGDRAWVSQFVTHRHPEFWENPEAFQPERFLPDAARGRHKYAFFPFGASSRHCIGQGFAMQELQLAVTALCERFRWSLARNETIKGISGFVLRPESAIFCRFLARQPETKS